MCDNKLHTPNGFKDYLPEQYKFKLTTERRIDEVFHQYGYASVSSPMLEYIEVFEGKGSTPSKQMYRFLDADGDVLTLRSDMTPPIARMAATNYSAKDTPLRFCYVENVYRRQGSYKGKAGEVTEAGVELIGLNCADADAEVIAIGIRSLLAVGLTDFRVDIGHVDFLYGILEEIGLPEPKRKNVAKALVDRDWVAVRAMTAGLSKGGVLFDIHQWIGGPDMLREIEKRTRSEKAMRAIAQLRQLYDLLRTDGVADYVVFDMTLTGHLDYYTGILFRGYCRGVGYSILDGGRYDGLSAHYGNDFPAVGFAIKIDHLLAALTNQAL